MHKSAGVSCRKLRTCEYMLQYSDQQIETSANAKAKYHMTAEQNIFAAGRNIINCMYKSAGLEGIGVTYPDTEAIFNGMNAAGISLNDAVAVNNLKHACQFVLDNIDCPMDYQYICKINQIIGGNNLVVRAGFVRNVPAAIGGAEWKPKMPSESKIKEKIADIQMTARVTGRAVTLMFYLTGRQMFFYGNKRTSMLAANQVMISNGCGIISVPVECQREFAVQLVHFYETNEKQELRNFIYENCIDGISFENINETEAPKIY